MYIYSITKGIVYCIQRQRVECIINKMCMHNEVWGCAEIFPIAEQDRTLVG